MSKRNPISRFLGLSSSKSIYNQEKNDKQTKIQNPSSPSLVKELSLSRLRALSNNHITNSTNSSYQPPTTMGNTINTQQQQQQQQRSKHHAEDSQYYDLENNNNNQNELNSNSYSYSSEYSSSHSYDKYENNPNPQTHSYTKANNHTASHALEYHESECTTTKTKSNKKLNVDDLVYNDETQQYYSLDELVDQNIYVVKQKVGYLAVGFGIVQTVILILMMVECGIAPLNINRKLIDAFMKLFVMIQKTDTDVVASYFVFL